jgi:hypothetical protein
VRKFCEVHESLIVGNISRREPNITYNSLLLINTARLRKLLAAIQFITEESRNKVSANKRWFTVVYAKTNLNSAKEVCLYKTSIICFYKRQPMHLI